MYAIRSYYDAPGCRHGAAAAPNPASGLSSLRPSMRDTMAYSIFSKTPNDPLKEPMFFGQSVNVARFDQQSYNFV